MSTPDDKRAVFISHASQDAATAQKICRLLEERGVSCWIAPRDVSPGTRYGEEIIHAIEAADVLVVILSDHANASNAVANEVERAFSNRKLIIPLRLKDVKPSSAIEFFVGQAQWIDMWDGPAKDKIDQVVASVAKAGGDVELAEAASAFQAKRATGRQRSVTATWIAACVCVVAAAAMFFAHARARRFRAGPDDFKTVVIDRTETGPRAVLLPRYRALVVGINDYARHGGSGWRGLVTARPDAEAVANLLETEYGFEVKRLLDRDATRGSIMAALDDLASLTSEDACVVYFAGHGFYDETLGEGYWIPADARRTDDGRLVKEDWLWNSTITKIIGASMARHILVIADSCYGGSLFRGDDAAGGQDDVAWYSRAISKPSRYLIASGDLEPVLDSGKRHSVFARQLLGFLQHTDKEVFSASDLGISLRESVSAITGQMVQMGPLAVAGHAGGEFVFVKSGAMPEFAAVSVDRTGQPTRSEGLEGTEGTVDRHELLRDALALGRRGATNAAQRLVALTFGSSVDDRLGQAVSAYLDRERHSEARRELGELIDRIEERKAKEKAGVEAAMDSARPRIMACLGPEVRQQGTEAESLALLYRICLRAELEGLGRVQIIEREALEQVLQEMNLGASDLADARARTAVGKLLPAGILLLGDILPTGKGETVYVRLVDTETSRILASFSGKRAADEDVAEVCAELASKIVAAAVKLNPLAARATHIEGNSLTAGIGRFHGAAEDMQFELVRRAALERKFTPEHKDQVVGTAQLAELGDTASDFTAEWTDDSGAGAAGANIWVREVVK